MFRACFLSLSAMGCVWFGSPAAAVAEQPKAAERPNIVVILADDVGYGDVGCYGATKVKTPHIDRLAETGLRFTDAYCASGTCTPTRYALLTGEYPWRKTGTAILPGDANLIIEPGRMTLPSMLRQAGYATGVVGKWHLGLGRGPIDWSGEIKPGPREIGFDYSFIIPATGDRVPCVYVENQRVVGLDPQDPIEVCYDRPVGNEPTGHDHPELLRWKLRDDVRKAKANTNVHGTIVNGISRIGYMSGGQKARWVDEDMADVITGKATAFIEAHQHQPFFLYFATHDIHSPRVPHSRFKGTSQCGVRGDVIQELDWSVGQIMATLDRLKLAENTLVIFTSDNGPIVDDGYVNGARDHLNGHQPAGPLRGGKAQVFEGGTREPFVLHWPARIKPGTSAALVGQIDLLSSLAALVGQKLPADAAPDSFNVLPALLGQTDAGREQLVEHGINMTLAIRQGPWKFIPSSAAAGDKASKNEKPAAGVVPRGQLYNLANDLGETTDVAATHPEIAEKLDAFLVRIRKQGRSRP